MKHFRFVVALLCAMWCSVLGCDESPSPTKVSHKEAPVEVETIAPPATAPTTRSYSSSHVRDKDGLSLTEAYLLGRMLQGSPQQQEAQSNVARRNPETDDEEAKKTQQKKTSSSTPRPKSKPFGGGFKRRR